MTNGGEVISKVLPLGSARAAASVAINVPAPGRFWTITVRPCALFNCSASRRAMISSELPAAIVSSVLLRLELKRLVKQLPGKYLVKLS